MYQDAPDEFRGVLIRLAYDSGFKPSTLREIICKILRKRPDKDIWSEYPNIDEENQKLIDNCEWYRVYNVVERICSDMKKSPHLYELEKFERDVNEYFIESGIGWQLNSGSIEARGSDGYETLLKKADDVLLETGKDTARKELYEAIGDLSRRPEPDITGAIQHAVVL